MSIILERNNTPFVDVPKDTLVIWREVAFGQVYTNILVKDIVIRHSLDGFEYGYEGSGPADLALNILNVFTNFETANKWYRMFQRELVATMPRDGLAFFISKKEIDLWIEKQERQEQKRMSPKERLSIVRYDEDLC